MNKVRWDGSRRGLDRLSGGALQVPKTSAGRLALFLRLRRLKAEFLRRQEEGRG